MKKVARLRIPPQEEASGVHLSATSAGSEHGVRTTGRIKKPKAVFDPSDNYLPRSQRASTSSATVAVSSSIASNTFSSERRSGQTRTSTTTFVSPTDSTGSNEFCFVCQKREAKRGSYAKNKLITCLDCGKRVHKLCLKMDFEDLEMLRQNYKCDDCRSCDICDAFADMDADVNREFVTCTKCVKSYHLTCHIPNVHKFQRLQRNWKCNKCTLPNISNGNMLPVKAIREIIGDETSQSKTTVTVNNNKPSPQQSFKIDDGAVESTNIAAVPVVATTVKRPAEDYKSEALPFAESRDRERQPGQAEKKLKQTHTESDHSKCGPTVVAANNHNSANPVSTRFSPNEPIDVPDVKYWTVDQVVEYFAKYFPNEAHVFKEQEIDGMSLLLLKRSDVIKKLPIKLGPSLRIYSLILKIQTQLNDPTLGWNCGL